MKKSSIRLLHLVLLGTVGLLFLGCITTGRVQYPYENGQRLKKAEMPSPETHTLIFGNMSRDGVMIEGTINVMEFAQINPNMNAKRVYPGTSYSLFYLYPVQPGSIMQLVYWLIKSGNSGVYSYPGIQKHNQGLTFKAEKPGLQYVGSIFLGRKPGNKKILGKQDFFFQERDTPDELEALKLLQPILAGTSWEQIVDKRVKELTNE